MRRRTRLSVTVAAATVVGLLSVGLVPSHDTKRSSPMSGSATAFASLPASPSPALKIGPPDHLRSSRYLYRWSIVRVSVTAHTEPSKTGTALTELSPTTSDGTANVLSVLRSRTGTDGDVWVEVRLPMLPNGSVGWVPRRALGAYESVNTQLVINRANLRATLYRAGQPVFSAPIGIGTARSPTPTGQFTVQDKLTRYASTFYGPVAFGTTARSAILTDWPGGGYIGIHGTNAPQFLPGRVSHGCVRMRNTDILRLATLMPIGTPVTIR